MTKGFDCASPLTAETAAAFAEDGYEFVCRYLAPAGYWKRLTAEEAAAISATGLQIVSVFETSADRALGGYDAGKEDGAIATQMAQEVGQLAGSTIYFAIDFQPAEEQLQTVLDYIRGASEATPDYKTGVYGSYAVIEEAVNADVCSHFWQTLAWSRGQQSAYANIYQNDCGPDGQGLPMNGIKVDLDESYGNEGWWSLAAREETSDPDPPPEQPAYLLCVDDANKIISLISGAYGSTDDPEAQAEFHRLANELRKASGQPEE